MTKSKTRSNLYRSKVLAKRYREHFFKRTKSNSQPSSRKSMPKTSKLELSMLIDYFDVNKVQRMNDGFSVLQQILIVNLT